MFDLYLSSKWMLTIIWLLLLPTLIQAQAPIQGQPSNKDIARMLQRADSYRVPYQASRSVSVVQVFVQGVLQKTRQYHVYSRGNGDVLVIFKSKAEAGQKMLMVDHHYWLMMPKSRRPIRITPMQKLLGDASVGDLSTIVWEQSYQAQWQATEQLQNLDGVMVNTEKLQLRAKHKNVSYANITLWLDATSHFPVKADLYLTSGKLAKQVWYQASQDNSQLRVASMGFSDLLQSGKHTIINYQQVTPIKLQDKYYNPAFLSRNALSGL